ncbi:hypothetical protein DRN75_02155 [Nanoarchaeota archaeon]|nr:MAG: hypothetical protein DRN75_02155 [Nanoarchaeota archaeon]
MEWYEVKKRKPQDYIRPPQRLRPPPRTLLFAAKPKNEEAKKLLKELGKRKKITIKEGLVFIRDENGIEKVMTIYEYCKMLVEDMK